MPVQPRELRLLSISACFELAQLMRLCLAEIALWDGRSSEHVSNQMLFGLQERHESVLASAVVWEDVVDIANLLAKLGNKRPDGSTFYFATRLASVLEFRNYCFIQPISVATPCQA